MIFGSLGNRTAGRFRTAKWRKNVARDCAFPILHDIFSSFCRPESTNHPVAWCTSQFQNRPCPSRAIPGHLTHVKLRSVGNLTQNKARLVGIWISCQNVCQRSETKGFRNSLIKHMHCIHGLFHVSFSVGVVTLQHGKCLCLECGTKKNWTRNL